MTSGLDRTSDMLDNKEKPENVMTGKLVKVFTVHGRTICGLFIGDKIRLHELSREDVFVIETSPGTRAYIKREHVSFVAVSDVGFVNNGDETINELNMVKKMFADYRVTAKDVEPDKDIGRSRRCGSICSGS